MNLINVDCLYKIVWKLTAGFLEFIYSFLQFLGMFIAGAMEEIAYIYYQWCYLSKNDRHIYGKNQSYSIDFLIKIYCFFYLVNYLAFVFFS